MHEDVIWSPNHCEFCTVVEFNVGPGGRSVGVTWSADRDYRIEDAKKMTFFVMGEEGGEEVRFNAVGKKADDRQDGGERPEFSVRTKRVTLDSDWKKLEIDLTDVDLTGMTNPFGIESRGNAVVFLKEVIIDDEEPEDPLEEEEENDD